MASTDELMEVDELDGFPDEETFNNYNALKSANQEKFQGLLREGFEFPLPQLLAMQFDVLVSLLPDDQRALWQLTFESRMEATLDQIIKDLPRIKLMQPMPRPNASKLALP